MEMFVKQFQSLMLNVNMIKIKIFVFKVNKMMNAILLLLINLDA